jgi:hypothetical protein
VQAWLGNDEQAHDESPALVVGLFLLAACPTGSSRALRPRAGALRGAWAGRLRLLEDAVEHGEDGLLRALGKAVRRSSWRWTWGGPALAG